MRKRLLSILICAAMLLALLPVSAFALEKSTTLSLTETSGINDTAKIEGTLKDDSDDPIVGATIWVSDMDFDVQCGNTNLLGEFSIAINPAMYSNGDRVLLVHYDGEPGTYSPSEEYYTLSCTKGSEYDLWLGSTPVNSGNKDDILGDTKAAYDPSTKTLTLNNYYVDDGYDIRCKHDLTIDAHGDNQIKHKYPDSDNAVRYAVKVIGDLNICGDGIFYIDIDLDSNDIGIDAQGKLVVDMSYPGSLCVVANSTAIQTEGPIDFSGSGSIYVDGGSGVHAYNAICFSNSKDVTILSRSGDCVTTDCSPAESGIVEFRNEGSVKLISSKKGVNIKNAGHAIFSGEGDVEITAGAECIYTHKDNVYVEGCSKMTLESNGLGHCIDFGSGDRELKLNGSGGPISVTANAGEKGINGTVNNVNGYYTLTSGDPAGYAFVYDVEKYNLWVGSKQVLKAYEDDVFGDGLVSYDPTTKTLTMNTSTIAGSHEDSLIYNLDIDGLTIEAPSGLSLDSNAKNLIYSKKSLNIEGDLDLSSSADSGYGIYSFGNLNIDGNVTVVGPGIASCGVFAYGSLNIDGNVNVTNVGIGLEAYSNALYEGFNGGIDISGDFTGSAAYNLLVSDIGHVSVLGDVNGTLTAPLPTSNAVYANRNINLGNDVTITGAGKGLCSENASIIMNGGTWDISADAEALKAKEGITIATGASITMPEGGAVNEVAGIFYVTESDGTTPAAHVIIGVEIPPEPPVPHFYDINVAEARNGSVTASRTSSTSGRTITLTVTPEKGYTLETLNVTKGSLEVALTNNEDGTYTFTMPSGDVTVTATFMEDNTMLNFFIDVLPSDWFYDSVLWAAVNGITVGTDSFHFSPYAPCTRAQVVTFLWKAAGQPVVNYAMSFEDVEEDAYYAEAVRWAASEKIVSGTSASTFRPAQSITREQLATIIYNYAKTKGQGFTGEWMFLLKYDDANQISSWANEAMHWCVMKGVVSGTSDTTLAPKKTANRAEIITMLYNYFQLAE